MKNNFPNLSEKPIGMFLLLVFTVLISKFIFLFISDFILNYLWSINIDILIKDIVNQDFKYVNAQKLIGFTDQIGTFLIPAIVIIKFKTEIIFEIKKISIKDIYLISFLLILLLASTNILNLFSQNINIPFVPESWIAYFKSQQLLQESIQSNFIGTSFKSLLINLFIMALTPAICEELFFRGSLQPILINWSKKKSTGIILSSIIFGILHFQAEYFLAIVFASILFGYLYVIKRNIIYGIIIHFCFNAVSLIMMQLINNGIYKEEFLEKIINYAITPIGLTMGIIWYYKNFKKG